MKHPTVYLFPLFLSSHPCHPDVLNYEFSGGADEKRGGAGEFVKVCLHDGVFNQISPEPEKGSQSSSPPTLNHSQNLYVKGTFYFIVFQTLWEHSLNIPKHVVAFKNEC